MRSINKLFAIMTLAISLLASTATAALAAAPSNDSFAGAKLVAVGFSESVDTSEATTDADDAQLLETCPAPATDASVWYALDGDGSRVAVDVADSSYSAGVIVATGAQGSLETVACGEGLVAFTAEVGTRYYVLAIDDQFDGGGNGGTLTILFRQSTMPEVEFSVDGYGRFDPRSGSATISGSVTCTAGADFSAFVEASQARGRSGVTGFGSSEGVCDGSLQRWTVVVEPEVGKFRGGKLETSSFGVASSGDEGLGILIDQTVKLRGGR
jgi:hypothetical protein